MNKAITLSCGRFLRLQCSHRFAVCSFLLLLLVAASAILALGFGSTPVSFSRIFGWLLGGAGTEADTRAIMQLRWPRIAAAILGGSMVAASGHLLQVVSRNGLADPGLLGISQGTIAAVIIGAAVFHLSPAWLSVAGLAGGMLTAIFVLVLSWKLISSNGLILVGIAVSILLGSLSEIIMTQGSMMQFSRWLTWSHGSLTAVSASDVTMMAIWAGLLLPLMAATSRAMAPLLLGHDQAAALGVSPRRMLPIYTLMAAALIAPVVSVAGPISFLGLISAHVARRLVGNRPGEVLVTAMLVGAATLLWSDTAGRILFLPVTVPAGIVISIIGIGTFLLAARFSGSRTHPPS